MNHLDETTARIHHWLTQNFPLAQQRNVGLDDSLLNSGIIDSLGTLEIVQYIESEFQVVVTDEEMLADHFETINAIAKFVDSKRQAKAITGGAEAN